MTRNHYDRLGHFAQGFVPAILAREMMLRRTPLKPGGWLFFLVDLRLPRLQRHLRVRRMVVRSSSAARPRKPSSAPRATSGTPSGTCSSASSAPSPRSSSSRVHDRQLAALSGLKRALLRRRGPSGPRRRRSASPGRCGGRSRARRVRSRPGSRRSRHDRDRRPRRADDSRAVDPGRVLRPGLRAREGPSLADGIPEAGRRPGACPRSWGPARSVGPVPPDGRVPPSRRSRVEEPGRPAEAAARSLRRRSECISGGRSARPIEFRILGVSPEPWQPVDSLAWAKMMAWDLAGNARDEIRRARFAAQVGPERAAELLPLGRLRADDPGRRRMAAGPASCDLPAPGKRTRVPGLAWSRHSPPSTRSVSPPGRVSAATPGS